MLMQGLPDKWWEATDGKAVGHLSKAVKFLCAKTAQTGNLKPQTFSRSPKPEAPNSTPELAARSPKSLLSPET
jgi:hypothetical protein